jgi:DNA-binding FadR family transcriptional regulator
VLAPTEQHGTLGFGVLEVAQSADPIREAIDFREVVEPAAARAAARSRTKRELAALRAATERMAAAGTDAEFMREDTAFHLAVARDRQPVPG